MRLLHVGFGFRPLRWGGLIAYAEDLMDAQVERGHQVGYFFAGRAYPFMSVPRLKRWERRGVAMFEIINPPVVVGGGYGTPAPLDDLGHPVTEAMFARALREFRPDVVHVQEMLGLPSSLFEVARSHGVPTLMTIEDYGLLCPTLKLFDADGNNCKRIRPGEMCAVCCRRAPHTQQGLVDSTMFYEETRFLEASRLKYVPRPKPLVDAVRAGSRAVQERWRRRAGDEEPERPGEGSLVAPAPPAEYDRRRAVNVERLSRVDLLLAMSTRVAEIHEQLGVDPARMRVMHLTLEHIARIKPRVLDPVERPVRFVTLAGLASREKGTEVLLRALRMLRDRGFGPDDFRLSVRGYLEAHAAEELPDHPAVTWDGFYGPEHFDEILDAADIGIVPSVWEECYGYVGIETLAKGLPVIGNRVGGITDYVLDGETGLLADATGEGLAAVMASVIEDPAQVNRLNRTILERREELIKPLAAHVLEMDDVYTDLIRGHVPSAL